MSRRVEFEWRISDPQPNGAVFVMERLIGFDKVNEYGPMPPTAAKPFITARRQWVHRAITTRTQALQIFEPRPALLLQAREQAKPKFEED